MDRTHSFVSDGGQIAEEPRWIDELELLLGDGERTMAMLVDRWDPSNLRLELTEAWPSKERSRRRYILAESFAVAFEFSEHLPAMLKSRSMPNRQSDELFDELASTGELEDHFVAAMRSDC